jgi:hypothetical protein
MRLQVRSEHGEPETVQESRAREHARPILAHTVQKENRSAAADSAGEPRVDVAA